MEAKKIFEIFDNHFKISDVPEWDNCGTVIASESKTINRILLTNDVSIPVIEEAISKKIELILSYHPPFLAEMKKIDGKWPTDLAMKMIKNNIANYVLHTSLDMRKNSINENLLSFMNENIDKIEIIDPCKNGESGWGRIFSLKQKENCGKIIKKLKSFLNLKFVKFSGDINKDISNIAVVVGSGIEIFKKMKDLPDLIITGELRYRYILEYSNLGVNVILTGHSNSERHYMKVLKEEIEQLLNDKCEIEVSERDQYPMSYE